MVQGTDWISELAVHSSWKRFGFGFSQTLVVAVGCGCAVDVEAVLVRV